MNNKCLKIFRIVFLPCLFSLLPLAGRASIFSENLGGVRGQIFTVESFFRILNGLACWFLQFGIIALGVMLVFYGILYIKSRGSSTGMTDARRALTWGIVGGLVIMGVFTIILTVSELVGYGAVGYTEYPILRIFADC